MKKQSFSLDIGTPCTENWDAMSRSTSGNFCARCEKTVIDFSVLSDEEIIRIIQTKSGKICGRLNAAQLHRSFIPVEQKQSASRFNTLVAGIAALGLAESTALAAQQTNTSVPTKQLSATQLALTYSPSRTASDSSHFTVSGKVLESGTDAAVPSALVLVKNTSCSTQTDSSGNFSLLLPDSLAADTIRLEINCIGYVGKEASVLKNSAPLIISVDPVEFLMIQGNIEVIPDNLQTLPAKRKHRKWFR